MGGSWQIKHLPEVERDLKRFLKPFKGKRKEEYVSFYYYILESLVESGIHPKSEREPLPGGVQLPQEVELWKISVKVPGLTGATAELRIIYLRYAIEKRLVIIAVYTHKDFEKRPPDRILSALIKGTLKKK